LQEEHAYTNSEYIKSLVFGGLDGIITTFAVVAAVAGAEMDNSVVILMGIANLVSDGISMGLGEPVFCPARRSSPPHLLSAYTCIGVHVFAKTSQPDPLDFVSVSVHAGDFLSAKSEKEYIKSEWKRETWEMENYKVQLLCHDDQWAFHGITGSSFIGWRGRGDDRNLRR
jgi:hypothetical protein